MALPGRRGRGQRQAVGYLERHAPIRFGAEGEKAVGSPGTSGGRYFQPHVAVAVFPDAKEWTIILNRDTAQWGTYDYKPALDVLRVKAKPTRLAAPVETMSLTVENLRPASADLVISWDRTQAALPITADPDRIVMGQIEQAMKGEKKPCVTAAQYYYLLLRGRL